MGIRSRIFFITLSCLFIGISLSFIVAERDLSLKLQEQIETELSRQAKIIRKSLANSSTSGDILALKSQVDEYASASDSRITIILKNGVVVVDSDIDAIETKELSNHSDRPEIIAAFNNGFGSSKRFSSTIQKEMFYFALLDATQTQERIIRISVPYEKPRSGLSLFGELYYSYSGCRLNCCNSCQCACWRLHKSQFHGA